MIYVRSKLNPTAITIIFLLKGLHEKSKHKAGGVSPRNYKKWNCEPMKMAPVRALQIVGMDAAVVLSPALAGWKMSF